MAGESDISTSSLESISDWLRRDIIIPSGGWLADVVPLLSDALLIWDIFILSAIFIASWVVLRISDSLTSLILGLAFDATIPLQHLFNQSLVFEHADHLDGYWPIFTFGTGVELLSFFLVHPDLFTLVVCIKTTLMIAIWLGKRKDGSFLTAKGGLSSSSGRSAKASRSARSEDGGDAKRNDRRRRKNGENAENPGSDRGKTKDNDGSEGEPSEPPTPLTTKTPKSTKPPRSPGTSDTGGSSDPSDARVRRTHPLRPDDINDGLGSFAPPGLGPPLTKEDLADDVARRGDSRRDMRPSDRALRAGNSLAPLDHRNAAGRPGQGVGSRQVGFDLGDGPEPPIQPAEPVISQGRFSRSPWARHKERRAAKQKTNGSTSPLPLFTLPPSGHIMPPGMATAQPLLSAAANPMNGRYIDFKDDQYQCKIARPKGEAGSEYLDRVEKRKDNNTAQWESALPHDSLDLLNFYLKALGIHRRTRAWMLMDLIENYDQASVLRTVRAWVKAYQTHESAETDPARRDEVREERIAMLRNITAPYHELEQSWEVWRASEGDWWDTGYVTTAGALIGAELDEFLWKMRQNRIGPMPRHAMLRDLLSQTTDKRYRTLRDKLLKAVEGSDQTAWETDKERKARLDGLLNEYQRKINFGSTTHISQEEVYYDLKAMKENRVPLSTQNDVIRKKRWGLSKEPWQVLVRKLDLGPI